MAPQAQAAGRGHISAPENLADPPRPFGLTGTVRGHVRDATTGRGIVGATLTVVSPLFETTAEGDGEFELVQIPPGARTLVVSADGYAHVILTLSVGAHLTDIDVALPTDEAAPATRTSGRLEETLVVTANATLAEAGSRILRRADVQVMPGAWGDPLKAAQALPGVARPFLGVSGELPVRGSAPEDTHLYIDGHEVPLLFHFGGLRSLVDADSIEQVEFLAGGFGAEFGRATGGVLDVHTRADRPERVHARASVDLLDASARVSVPVGESSSVSASVRGSYLDRILKSVEDDVVVPRYADYNLHATTWLEAGDRVELLMLGTRDGLVAPAELGDRSAAAATEFHHLQGHWDHPLGPRKGVEVSLSGSVEDGLALGDIQQSPRWRSQLRASGYTGMRHRIDAETGIDLTLTYQRAAGLSAFSADTEELVEEQLGKGALLRRPRSLLLDTGAYGALEWRATRRFRLMPGLRADYFDAISTMVVDPRLGMSLQLSPTTALSARTGLYHQPPRVGLLGSAVFDLGALGLDVPPERAVHVVAGFSQVVGSDLRFEASGYYKHLDHLSEVAGLDYSGTGREQVVLLVDGSGRAYGLELSLRWRPDPRFSTSVSYTRSVAERRGDSGWFPFGYDQPHQLSASASWKVRPTVRVGTRLRYVSGSPYTPYEGLFDADTGEYWGVPGEPFSARLPPSFQMDLRFDKWIPHAGSPWRYHAYLDILNVTNRRNAELPWYSRDFGRRGTVSGLPILPMLGFEVIR